MKCIFILNLVRLRENSLKSRYDKRLTRKLFMIHPRQK